MEHMCSHVIELSMSLANYDVLAQTHDFTRMKAPEHNIKNYFCLGDNF